MDKWILLSEGLPEIREEVLLYFEDGNYSLGYRSDDKQDPEYWEGWVVNDGDYINSKITHWKKLIPPNV